MAQLTTAQIEALRSMRDALLEQRWVLIGATAIACRAPLRRTTTDVDVAVVASGDIVYPRIEQAGWRRHPSKWQSWIKDESRMDLLATPQTDRTAGQSEFGDGFVLSVIGFDLVVRRDRVDRCRK